jgi:hypothetical protein
MQIQPMFDTLKYVNHLTNHEFNERQAEGLLGAQVMVQESSLVTKHDLELVRLQLLRDMDERFAQVNQKFAKVGKRIDSLDHKIDHKINKATIFLCTTQVVVMSFGVGILAYIN